MKWGCQQPLEWGWWLTRWLEAKARDMTFSSYEEGTKEGGKAGSVQLFLLSRPYISRYFLDSNWNKNYLLLFLLMGNPTFFPIITHTYFLTYHYCFERDTPIELSTTIQTHNLQGWCTSCVKHYYVGYSTSTSMHVLVPL